MIQKTCENPNCGASFEVSERYAKAKRFCSIPCGARAGAARYRQAHPETTKAAAARWREANPDRNRANNREWYEAHREEMIGKMRSRYQREKETNPEKLATEARERYERLRFQEPWRKLLASARTRATKRELEYNLTTEWITSRWTGRCEFSNVPFDILGTKLFAPSIDRINPKLGYIQSNCRVVLWAINMLKAEFSDVEVMLVVEAIIKYRGSPPEEQL